MEWAERKNPVRDVAGRNETQSCPVCFSQEIALAHRKRWRSFQLGAGRHEKESWDYLRCGCVQLVRRPIRDLWLP